MNKSNAKYLPLRRIKKIILAASISAFFCSAYCQDIYTSFHSQAEAAFGNQFRATVLSDGLPLSIWELYASENYRQSFLKLLDHTIEPNWISSYRTASISQSYKEFFSESKWGRKIFTKEEEADYQKFLALLFVNDPTSPSGYRPSKEYTQYSIFLKNYKKLRDDYDKTPPEDRTAAMYAKLNEAKQKLENQGQQALFREAESRLKSLLGRDYSLSFLPKIKKIFEQNTLPNNELRTEVSPKISPAMKLFSWNVGTLKPTSDIISAPVFGYTAAGANARLRICSSAGVEIQNIDLPPGLVIKMEMAKIEIIRPWLDSEALSQTSGLWTWKDSTHAELSDSVLTANNFSPLTFIPNSLIAVRNIRIEATWSNTTILAISQAILDGNTVRLGPFVIAAPTIGLAPQVVPSFIDEKTIFIGVLQILGAFVSQHPTLPASVASSSIVFDSPLPDLPFLQ